MNGSITFKEALSCRLEIMKPSIHQLEGFIKSHPPRLTDGIVELVEELNRRKVDVYLVSLKIP